MSAVAKQNFFEKVAKNLGILYRHHFVKHGPRRKEMLKNIWQKEIAPPTAKDIPQIKKDLATLISKIESEAYRELPLKEFLAYAVVFAEVMFWFFVGEQIGRWNKFGYIVRSTYKDPKAVKFMKKYVPEDKTKLA